MDTCLPLDPAPGRPSWKAYWLCRLVVVCAALLSSGCSIYKIAYHAAPTYVVKGLFDTFTLSEVQKKQTESAIAELFA